MKLIKIIKLREIKKFNYMNKFIKVFDYYKNIELMKKECTCSILNEHNNHYKYSPLINNGECRFCLGFKKKNDEEIIKLTRNKIKTIK